MKQKLSLFIFFGLLSFIISSYRNGAANNAGVDCSGSDGVTTGCAASGCHTSATTTSLGTTLEFDSAGVPTTSYIPGGSYTIKITATNATGATLPYFGCQMATVTSGGAQAGTWSSSLPATMQLTPTSASGLSIPFVEQSDYLSPASGSGGAGTVYTETVSWTAPAAGTGSVKIFGIIQAVNHNNGRSGDKCQQAPSLTITEAVASSCPTVSLSASGTTLTASPAGGTSYTWHLNGNVITGATSATYTPVSSGSYTVDVASSSSCSGTSNAVTFTVTGINDPSLSSAIQVYPTVTGSIVNVKINGSMDALTYHVYDLNGRAYETGSIAAGTSNTTIDMSKLSSGLYIISIADQNRTATYKVVRN